MNKKIVTEIVRKELPDRHTDKELPLEKIMFKWWSTGRSGNVLRLTDEGYNAFVVAGMQEYSYAINLETLSVKLNSIKGVEFTLKLGKLLKCPWYLTSVNKKTCSLKIFDSKVAMFINLYGTVEDYLQLKV